MKLNTKYRLANRFNRPESVVVIASFPQKSNRSIQDIDAVASYTDHMSRAFAKQLSKSNRKLIILAQKTDGEQWYEEHGMLVGRVWEKGSAISFLHILQALKRMSRVRSILVQFEFHQFGGNTTTALFPLFLAGLKAMGKTVNLVMHQVVTEIDSLSGHVDINPGSKRAALFNRALRMFYTSTSTLSDSLIVHNHVFADRLTRLTGRNDITVIPHGLGAIKPKYSTKQAREILGLKKSDLVIMTFGFLTWYKGTDWLVHTFANKKSSGQQLLIAGGQSPNLSDKPHYQTFVRKLTEEASTAKNITITGFVEDPDVPLYFAAADLVVLPYRTLMSASGPLAMTIAMKKPFLISRALSAYTSDGDFRQALKMSQLKPKDLIFSLKDSGMWNKIETIRNHPTRYKKLVAHLETTRNWQSVAVQFDQAIRVTSLAKAQKSAILGKSAPLAYATT